MPTHKVLRAGSCLPILLVSLLVMMGTRDACAEEDETHAVDDLDLVKLLNVEVSTASKTKESVDEAPAIITVVTRDDIERWGYQSVAEVLNHTMGFYLVDDHILPNAAVRGVSGGLGAESGVIKVMIDGRSVAYRTTSGNWLGVELIPLGSIQQIEIIRGPASALYGADAFLGVVNIITLPPEKVRPIQARATLGHMGSSPSLRVDAVSGGKLGPFDWLLGVAGEQADRSGLSLPEESPAPILPEDIGERRHALDLRRESLVLQGRLGYRGTLGELEMSAYGSGIRRGGDFAHWAQLTSEVDQDGNQRGTVVALQQLRLNLDGLLHVTDDFDLALQGTYFQGGLLPQDRIEIASDLFYVERHQSYRGFDATMEGRFRLGERLSAIVGVETVLDRERLLAPTRIVRSTGEAVSVGAGTAPGADVRLFNLGTFLSLNAKVWDPWVRLTGGLRYDRHSQYGDQVTGRFGATTRLGDVVVKALYGSAFKAPSPYLLYATPLRTGDVIGSPTLAPQFVHTVEGQVSYEPSRFFSVSSGVAHSWLLDKAEFTAQGINLAARNVARQRTLSWETRADVRYYNDFRGYATFEPVWSERDLGREGFVADLVGSANVVYPSWISRGGWMVGVPSTNRVPLELAAEAIIVGQRRAADTSIVQNGGDLRFDPYVLLDVSLASREIYLAPGHESRFALRTRNLLLSRGPDPGPSGFEYPLRPGEIFLELRHTY